MKRLKKGVSFIKNFEGVVMKKILLLIIISIFLVSNISQAQTIDDFNYTGNLNANGWSTHSGSGSNVIATTTGLSYSGYINSGIGNAALQKNLGGEDINYTAGIGPYNTNGTTVYFSFMVNVTESANKTGDYFIHIGDRASATSFSSFSARIFERVVAGSVNFGISNTSTASYGTTNFSKNTSYLIVVKYTINTGGNDRADLWVLSSGVPISEAAAGSTELSSTTTAGQDVIDAIALRQGSSSTSVQTVVDGIRVATSWSDLLFVPEATSATSIVSTSFYANWNAVAGASGYYLDIATDAAFTSMVSGYNNLDVGNVTTKSVTGLTAGVTYYYRVRAYNGTGGTGPSSNTINVTTIQLVLGATEAGALNYTEGDPATSITGTTAITSSVTNLDTAVVQITRNYQNGQDVLAFTNTLAITGSWDTVTGKLKLSGTDTWQNYQAALRSITYQNTSQNPSTLQRTVSFTVSIGSFNSNTVTRNVSVTAVNNAPVLAAIEVANLGYGTGAAKQITNSITISDVDNSTMAGATVQITAGYDMGKDVLLYTDQNGIAGTWTSATGTLSLTGTSGIANYQAALRSIQFQNNSLNASTVTRTVSFAVNDGASANNISVAVTRNITVNNTPVIAAIEGTQLNYSAGDPPTLITGTITVNDIDNTNLASAVIQFSSYFEWGKDVLSFTNANGITGSWDATNGILTLSGISSIANYQTALRSVTYQNTSATHVKLIRTIRFSVNDGTTNSTGLTRDINLGFTQLALNGIETDALLYKQGDVEKNITNGLTISSPSSPTINSATIKITDNYQPGEDVLTCLSQNQIISVWNAVEGKIDLSWPTSVVNYQAALRSVTYKNISASPLASPRTVSFVVSDGYNTSNTVERTINVSVLRTITLATNSSVGGTVAGDGTFFTGNPVTVTATPNTGYSFVNWTEGGVVVSTNSSYTFIVDLNRSLTANFAIIQYAVTTVSSPDAGGTTTGGGTFDYGTIVTVTATPNVGYAFLNWTSGGALVSTSQNYTFTVSGIYNLVANFMMLPVLTVTPDFITVGPGSGTASFNVTNTGGGTMDWTAVSDIFWIKIKTGASGTNGGTINVTYDHNNSASRIGTITIIAAGVSGSPKIVEIRQDEPVTFVENLNLGIPDDFRLEQNYPNPFNPSTKIRYGLPKESNVVLTVYNILGEEVAKLVNDVQSAGYYEASFAATNLSSGIYVYRISAGNFSQIRKMLLIK